MRLIRKYTDWIRWLSQISLRSTLTSEFKVLSGKIFLAITLVAIIIVIEGVALWYVSSGSDSDVKKPSDGIYFVLVNIFGETTSPTSIGARLITLLALLEGLILATYLIAVSAFFTIRGGRIMSRKHSDHYVICGWNFQGPRIIQELISARGSNHFDIVVIPGEKTPDTLTELGNKVFVVNGSPTEDSVLSDGDIERAKTAIILTNPLLDPNTADSQVVMITLAIETMNPDVYTCAQVMNSQNEIHLRRANVDETIPFDVLGANLSVASAINPGITRMVSELVHFDDGSEFYRIDPPLPKGVVGLEFKEASSWFTSREMILVGVESDELRDSYGSDEGQAQHDAEGQNKERGVFVNPKNYTINSDDALFVISDDDPNPDL